MSHEEDNTASSILRAFIIKETSTHQVKARIPSSIFLSIDKKIYPAERDDRDAALQNQIHQQSDQASVEAVPTGRFGKVFGAYRKNEAVEKLNENNMLKTKNVELNNMMLSSIRKTFSRTDQPERADVDNQLTLPKRNLTKQPKEVVSQEQQVLIITLTFEKEEYEVYYKHQGTIKEFLAYLSRLRSDRELDNCICVNSYTLEILGLDFELAEFQDSRISLELVSRQLLVKAKWRKVKRNRFELEQLLDDQKEYWVSSTDILKEYEQLQQPISSQKRQKKRGGPVGSTVWYFEDQYIDHERSRAIKKDLNTYFPELTAEQAELLTHDDIKGFKIYKNFSYYLEGIGLKISSIANGAIVKSNHILFREIVNERHDEKAKLEKVIRFMYRTGFFDFVRSLTNVLKGHLDLDSEESEQHRQGVPNKFLVNYEKRKISSADFLELIEQVMKNKERHCQFLRDVWIYEFWELKRPCSESLQALKMHNFDSYQDWFFPTLTIVGKEEAIHIKASLTAGKNIIEAYRHYLSLFDLELSDSYSIRKTRMSLEKFKHPLNKTKHLERIIISLSVLGFRPIAIKFLTFLRSVKSLTNSWQSFPDLENEAKCKKVYDCEPEFLSEHHILIKKQLETCSLI